MHCCTGGDPAAHNAPAPGRWPRRIGTLFQLALPVTALVLFPKCPACVAGYVLFLTGMGLSLPAAAAMRWILIALSIATLVSLLHRVVQRALSPQCNAGATRRWQADYATRTTASSRADLSAQSKRA